jgi:hypothetical protein
MQLDLILYRKRRGLDVRDCGAIPGEACLKQHRMVRAGLRIEGVKKKKWKEQKKIRTWKLKDAEVRERFKETLEQKRLVGDGGFKKFAKDVLDAGREVCGETSGRRGIERERDVVVERRGPPESK